MSEYFFRPRRTIILIVLAVAVILIATPLEVLSEDAVFRTETEKRYFQLLKSEMRQKVLSDDFVEGLAEERNISESNAKSLLTETARLSSICAVLGARLHDDLSKAAIVNTIKQGGGTDDIATALEKSMRERFKDANQSQKDQIIETIEEAVGFSRQCIDAAHESALK